MQSQRDDSSLALRNDFTYGGISKEGACPFAAHIRKAHIRIGTQLNQSRIMRRGIPYGEDFNGGADNNRSLLFACYQSTIEDGYRFIQHSWANNPDFPVPGKSGFDVTIGQGTPGPANPFIIGTKSAPVNPVNDFVTTKGGEYFFAPSIGVLKAGFDLSKLPAQAPQAKL